MTDSFPDFWKWLHGFFNKVLFEQGSIRIEVGTIFIVLFAMWFFHLLAYFVERALHRALFNKEYDHGAKTAMERLARYAVYLVGIIVVLAIVGVNLRSLETFGAVIGVGIGFGLQNITQNFISGLILLTERPIKRGDLVEVEGTVGRVLDIRARSTLVLTRDDVVIIVPNSEFITKQVINQSFSGHKMRRSVLLKVAPSNDPQQVEEILNRVAGGNPKVLQTPPPNVIFKEINSHSLDFSLNVWLDDLWFSDRVLSELRFAIDKEFKAHQILLPQKESSS